MQKVILFSAVLCIAIFLACGGGPKPTLKLEKTTFAAGEEITVSFTAPSSYEENAWVGIIPSDVPHGSESQNDQYDLVYIYLEKQTSGTMTFFAPGQAGAYDFRMHDTDDNGNEIIHVTFEVIAE